jgi:hypothetical protein
MIRASDPQIRGVKRNVTSRVSATGRPEDFLSTSKPVTANAAELSLFNRPDTQKIDICHKSVYVHP